MITFHISIYRPIPQEVPLEGGDWCIEFELHDDTGIPSGDGKIGIMLPKGASEDDVRALQRALHIKGATLALIEQSGSLAVHLSAVLDLWSPRNDEG
ncbi:hypothetical protein [Actibacterium sp. 188UL27-1]|uniref:hypothetical protein n=1 Tax=Actibacterium sp. 188UL27-1 TaxID=2786961 RepID=UPI001959DEDD|nr:hypothetical protein [Actibacterium sp. 188UL27-1]MBM7069249.1 hypothetical protein [Actibacterium sp. 188UL27-1]